MANDAVKLNNDSARKLFGDYLLMLTVPCFTACWFYGMRALAVVAASVAAAAVASAREVILPR